jgi:regulator of cell morphogenesis and NO signaling
MSTSTQSIREIVSAQPSAAAVFERFDIDICSHADASLKQACAALQLSVDQVLEKLADAAAQESGSASADVTGFSLSRLIQHIVRSHHQYVRRALPRLVQMSAEVAAKHGERVPELKRVDALVSALRSEMFAHLEKEEQILFPFIAQMEEAASGFAGTPHACFRTVAHPVAMMVREHESAEGLVAEIRDLTHGFAPPADACLSQSAFFAGLAAFEGDLRQHVHLENDILFPRAIELESTLYQRS